MFVRISVLCCLFGVPAFGQQNDRPTNVIFILADDLGYGDLGCYGAEQILTPSCDRLAREGVQFTDAHSPSAVCTPTRYSLLTGRYCWRTWLKNWVLFERHPLLIEQNRLTMGKLFQEAGYVTGCVGKWHLGWGNRLNPDLGQQPKPGPLECGFDHFFGVPFSHNSKRSWQVFLRDRSIVNLKPGVKYDSPEALQHTVRSLEQTATNLSKEAVKFIEDNRERPFFLYYPTTNIHFPLTPDDRFQDQSDAGVYGDFTMEFDWAVGQILDTLDRYSLTDDTLILLTSDNGARPHPDLNGHSCNGRWRGTKRQSYEGGHRVPLIVRWPSVIPAGRTCQQTVCLTDFFRTFAGILEHPIPLNAGEDSYDIIQLLREPDFKDPIREATVHHSVAGQFSLRLGDWKLIEGAGDGDYPRQANGKMAVKNTNPTFDQATERWTDLDYFDIKFEGPDQLYNLRDDPGETTNVASAHPEQVASMKRLLNHYRESGRSYFQADTSNQ